MARVNLIHKDLGIILCTCSGSLRTQTNVILNGLHSDVFPAWCVQSHACVNKEELHVGEVDWTFMNIIISMFETQIASF